MKAFLIILTLSILLLNQSCAQPSYKLLEGTWKSVESMDCPDILVLKPNSVYVILNDCGVQKPGIPVIEKGKWDYIQGQGILKLMNREFKTKNSVFSEFHGRGELLLFKVEACSEEELILCFYRNGNDCIEEKYRKYELPSINRSQ